METITFWISADDYNKAVELAASAGKSLEQWLHDVVMADVGNAIHNQD